MRHSASGHLSKIRVAYNIEFLTCSREGFAFASYDVDSVVCAIAMSVGTGNGSQVKEEKLGEQLDSVLVEILLLYN